MLPPSGRSGGDELWHPGGSLSLEHRNRVGAVRGSRPAAERGTGTRRRAARPMFAAACAVIAMVWSAIRSVLPAGPATTTIRQSAGASQPRACPDRRTRTAQRGLCQSLLTAGQGRSVCCHRDPVRGEPGRRPVYSRSARTSRAGVRACVTATAVPGAPGRARAADRRFRMRRPDFRCTPPDRSERSVRQRRSPRQRRA